jgi:hypothetical protein
MARAARAEPSRHSRAEPLMLRRVHGPTLDATSSVRSVQKIHTFPKEAAAALACRAPRRFGRRLPLRAHLGLGQWYKGRQPPRGRATPRAVVVRRRHKRGAGREHGAEPGREDERGYRSSTRHVRGPASSCAPVCPTSIQDQTQRLS